MKFRLKLTGLHLLSSALALLLVLGILYLGWYHWPGWYLANASHVFPVLVGVDLALGPALTFVVAQASKPRRVLRRDIAVIVCVQLVALLYGSVTLWNGRPLYYAFSENLLQVVQAYDLDPRESALARSRHAELAPHWYSLPRWIWVPLPADQAERDRIVSSAVQGGEDVIAMPGYFRPWEQGLPALRGQLTKLDEIRFFSKVEKDALRTQMRAAGLAVDQANSIAFTGRGRPLLAVFDLATMKIIAIFEAR